MSLYDENAYEQTVDVEQPQFTVSGNYQMTLKELLDYRNSEFANREIGDTIKITMLYVDSQVIRNDWQQKHIVLVYVVKVDESSYDVTKVYDSGYNMNYRVKNGLAEGKQLGYYNDGKELESTAMFVRGKKRG